MQTVTGKSRGGGEKGLLRGQGGNKETTLWYIENVILPYIEDVCKKRSPPDQVVLVISDVYKGHVCDSVHTLLESNTILQVHVSNNCTDLIQPLKLSVNKPFKDKLQSKSSERLHPRSQQATRSWYISWSAGGHAEGSSRSGFGARSPRPEWKWSNCTFMVYRILSTNLTGFYLLIMSLARTIRNYITIFQLKHKSAK